MYLYYYINPCQPHSISIYPFQFIQSVWPKLNVINEKKEKKKKGKETCTFINETGLSVHVLLDVPGCELSIR